LFNCYSVSVLTV